MKRILSVTFPKLEHITGVFAKSILQLLIHSPSANALRRADADTVAALVIPRSWGKKSRTWVETLMTTAASSIGDSNPAKELVLKQDASLLLYVQEQIKETTKVLASLCAEKMKKDVEILTSIKGVGKITALNFLVEMGADINLYGNDKKLIAAAGLDPSNMLRAGREMKIVDCNVVFICIFPHSTVRREVFNKTPTRLFLPVIYDLHIGYILTKIEYCY